MAPTITSSSSPAVARPSWAQIVKGVSAPEPAWQPEEEEKAQIVKGASAPEPAWQPEEEEKAVLEEEVVQPLRPARRGERLCRCVGQVLVMLRHYGWIAPLDPIEHPDSHKNGGRIYVSAADVESSSVLAAGDRVSFFLYVDMQGLGAEGCCLASESLQAERSLASATTPEPGPRALSAEAAVFKPGPSKLSADAAALERSPCVLSAKAAVFEPRPQRLLPEVEEFVPSGGMSAGAAVFVPAKSTYGSVVHDGQRGQHGQRVVLAKSTCGSVLQFNDAYLSDSDDEGAEAGDELSSQGGEPELSDGSMESHRRPADYPVPGGLQGHVEWDDDLDVVVLCAPLKASGTALSAGSTSAGEHSDSEDELISPETPAALIPVGMPPGLSVLAP